MARQRISFTFSSVSGYLSAVDYLLDHINDREHIQNPNKYAFILVASAALEAILNEAIIWWASKHFPVGDHKRMATSFLSMNLRGKLDAAIHLLSDGQYISNNQSTIYKRLSELIKVRNEVAHSKNFFHESELEFEEHGDGHFTFEIPDTMARILGDTPLSQATEQCTGYRDALHKLHDLIAGGHGSLDFDTSQFCKKAAQQNAPN